jgi:hypothetical protein
MSLDNIKISEEKLKLLIGMLLKENNFEVIDLNLDVQTYTPEKTTSETPDMLVSDYLLDFIVDYYAPLNGDNPSLFLGDFSKMLSLAYKSVSTYIIGNDGKITTDTSDVYISYPTIVRIDYLIEETHIMTLSFHVILEKD